ncbi:MAG: flagellar biosynthesis protein FlhF [Planctomycetota bacterium]
MSIRTYRARSMADAIDAVQRDMGRDAVILHTRNYRVGGLFGIGGRPVVEVTASPASAVRTRQKSRASRSAPATPRPAAASTPKPQSRPGPAADPLSPVRRRELLERYTELAAARPKPAPGAARSVEPRATDQRVAERPRTNPRPRRDEPAESQGRAAGETLRVHRSAADAPDARGVAAVAPAAPPAAIEHELRTLRRMVGRVLRTQSGGLPSGLPEPLAAAYAQLLDADVAQDLADAIIDGVRESLSREELHQPDVVRGAVLGQTAAAIPIARAESARRPEDGRPRTIALVGPTGVGKTTTIAKLAAAHKLRRGRRVGLITTDTFRIAAVEQLRTYAGIISVPLRVVMSPAEMASACRSFASCDLVLIDTAGRSPRDGQRLDELAAHLEAADPHETHLVLSATSGAATLRDGARGFAIAEPNRVILTKLDEAASLGSALSALHGLGLPVSYVTTGQEVPDHIERARADRLARMVLRSAAGSHSAEGADGEHSTATLSKPQLRAGERMSVAGQSTAPNVVAAGATP